MNGIRAKHIPLNCIRRFKKASNTSKTTCIRTKTNEKSIRALIVGDYIIFYEHSKKDIIIHTLWDSRQDPEGLIFK